MAASLNDSAVLGASSLFQGRVQASLLSACNVIAIEGNNVVNHTARLQLAHTIVANPTNMSNYAQMLSFSVATDSNVLADATVGGTVVLSVGNRDTQQVLVTDAHINSALAAFYNTFCPGIAA